VLLDLLVAMLIVAAMLLMAMPFVLVRHSRQHQDPSVVSGPPQLLPDPAGPE
jgi:hypothetical protein